MESRARSNLLKCLYTIHQHAVYKQQQILFLSQYIVEYADLNGSYTVAMHIMCIATVFLYAKNCEK